MGKPRQELPLDKPTLRLPMSATLANVALSIPEDPLLWAYKNTLRHHPCNVMAFRKDEVCRG